MKDVLQNPDYINAFKNTYPIDQTTSKGIKLSSIIAIGLIVTAIGGIAYFIHENNKSTKAK